MLLIINGLAEPPYAGPLQWQATTPQDWDTVASTTGITFHAAPVNLPVPSTLVIQAENTGPDNSAWGAFIQTSSEDPAPRIFMLDNQRYATAAGSNSVRLDWMEFMHIQPSADNTLRIDIAEESLTLYINDELVYIIDQQPPLSTRKWGIVTRNTPIMHWQQIAIYANTAPQP